MYLSDVALSQYEWSFSHYECSFLVETGLLINLHRRKLLFIEGENLNLSEETIVL